MGDWATNGDWSGNGDWVDVVSSGGGGSRMGLATGGQLLQTGG